MILIPDHVLKLKTYKPGKSPEEVKQELGLDQVAVLWNNENNYGASPKAREEIKKVLTDSYLYPDPTALRLRKLIAEKVGRGVEHIAVENGSEAILNNIFQAFFFDNDELVTCDGSFVAVYIWAQAQNVDVTKVPLTSTYHFDLHKLKQSISNKTKAIYIANPNNPTGTMIEKKELREFVEDIPDDILIIIDEAYSEFAGDLSMAYPDSARFSKPNVITLRTFSKAYGVAGIRIGYAIGSPEVIEALNKVKMTFAPSNVAQAAGIGAIQDAEFLGDTVKANTKWISKFYQAFKREGLNFIPSYANFVMLDLKTEERAAAFTGHLADLGVFVRHLKAFSLPHCVRITVGTDGDNSFFLEKLPQAVAQL